jgi:hypothetical protein
LIHPRPWHGVKLRWWVERNYHDVVAMYEDWHSLVGVDAAGQVVTRRIAICRHSELDQVKARPRQMPKP